MITEDYVSFETAKLLKEKGFDEKCFALYNPNGTLIQSGIRLNNTQVGRVEGSYSAPTLQMAMKWLREVHKLFIQVTIVPHTTITMEQKYFLFLIHKDRRRLRLDDTPKFTTYEEACEAAIKYCLENLI